MKAGLNLPKVRIGRTWQPGYLEQILRGTPVDYLKPLVYEERMDSAQSFAPSGVRFREGFERNLEVGL